MRKIIMFNGPPRSGKDASAEYMKDYIWGNEHISYTANRTRFSTPVKERTHALYNIVDPYGSPVSYDYFEDVKDEPNEEFIGLTPRQAYINTSELLMKPVHGENIWAKLVADEIEEYGEDSVIELIPDLGFPVEYDEIVRRFGENSVYVVRIEREGKSFEGDSRKYIEGANMFTVINNGTMKELEAQLKVIAEKVIHAKL